MLPADLSTVARGVLEGPCVVQVEAVRDISESGPDATERSHLNEMLCKPKCVPPNMPKMPTFGTKHAMGVEVIPLFQAF